MACLLQHVTPASFEALQIPTCLGLLERRACYQIQVAIPIGDIICTDGLVRETTSSLMLPVAICISLQCAGGLLPSSGILALSQMLAMQVRADFLRMIADLRTELIPAATF